MLKGYRKRFVLFNMLLVGVALFLMLLVQGVFLFRSSYAELQNTMRMVVRPFHLLSDTFRERELPPEVSKKPDEAPRDLPGPTQQTVAEQDIITVFYRAETDEITVLSGDSEIDSEAVNVAVREAASQEAAFGKLADGSWFYYKEGPSSDLKIALTDGGYLREKMLPICLMLFSVYLGAMGLVFLISLRLSKLAAKPMERAIEMERRFIVDISHDLKTPITVVLANSSILQSNPGADAQERSQWIESTDAAAKKMMTMVDQMLTLSSLEAVERKPEKVPVALSSIAEKATLELEPLAYERGIAVETEIAENVVISATEDYTERICGSLLENAIKYEPDGGTVRLKLFTERKKAILQVQNVGSVISPEDLPHIFERFYRSDKARSAQGGHGLGLPILKQIADLLGAKIEVSSNPNDGTVFSAFFDCAE